MRFKEILGLFFLFCWIFKRDASRQIKLPFKLQKQLEMTTNLDAKEKKKKLYNGQIETQLDGLVQCAVVPFVGPKEENKKNMSKKQKN